MRATPGTATHVINEVQARQLGQRLTDQHRKYPFVVITLDKERRSPFDADDIAAALGFRADVWVVDDQHVRFLNRSLGSETVYGGAAGVFPPPGQGRVHRHLFTEGHGHGDADVIAKARAAAPCRPGRAADPAPPAQPAPHSLRPTTGLHRVETAEQVDALAAHLLSPDRDRPVAVVTIPMRRTDPWIDPQEIVDAVGPDAEVHLIATGPRTFQLTAHLNRLAGVYGGAGRVYDVGTDWLADPRLSPLRFAYDGGEGRRATGALITDLLGGLARTGHLTSETTPAERQVRGKVSGLVPPSRAIVRLEDGTPATVWAELTTAGLDIDAILAPDMRIVGRYDPGTRRVDVTQMLRTPQDVLADLSPDVVVLARVEAVEATSVTLIPFPGTRATVPADLVTGNDLDDLTALLSPGEVVTARFLGADDAQSWRLSLLDVDDDECPVPVALIPSGPPWLDHPASVDDAPDSAPVTEPADDGAEQERLRAALTAAETRLHQLDETAGQLGELTRRVAELETQLSARDLEVDSMQRDLRDRQRDVAKLQRQLEHERTAKRRLTQQANSARTAPAKEVCGHLDPRDQMRWDLLRTWVEQTRPEDKADWPLPEDYGIGPDFCRTVTELEGVSRDRVLLVAVRVLTGRGVTGDHPLRSSRAGGAPAVTRVRDGVEWTCRRAPLQQSSPSARRLSYWRGPSGQIELSRVTVHDDLTP
ncbi:hypothetical protein [Janibacter anophelis]|uniref:hypothetical protein n=1 Tax=Janibacter anophelis TaxID=319054 RepID=UPI000DEFAA71|nr:hypothetical protein [Janibacter anophelis]